MREKNNLLSFITPDGEKLEVVLTLNEEPVSVEELLSSHNDFEFSGEYEGEKISGYGKCGDDAIWLPIDYDHGVKVVFPNEKYGSLEAALETLDLVQAYEERTRGVVPEILSHGIVELQDATKALCIEMQRIHEDAEDYESSLSYVPAPHRKHISSTLHIPPRLGDKFAEFFVETKLLPEDEWYKRGKNQIAGKIVDFHRFEKKKNRYLFPSNGMPAEEMSARYRNMVSRYTEVLDQAGRPKWKGRIYQGFCFDNGYNMQGYISPGGMFDSYKKLPYIPYNKCKGKKVLDIGSNQGFFSFQAAMHGASEVTGIEMTSQDVAAANDIKQILQLDNVSFINGDAVKYVKESSEKYSIVIMNSVLHQIFPNFSSGADEFLSKVSDMTDYFAFETPLNHPLMNISPQEVEHNLRKHFSIVRLLNVYDAYSSGYRANYICYK